MSDTTTWTPPEELEAITPNGSPIAKASRLPRPDPQAELDKERQRDAAILTAMETNRKEIARLQAENDDLSERHAYYAKHVAWLERNLGASPKPGRKPKASAAE